MANKKGRKMGVNPAGAHGLQLHLIFQGDSDVTIDINAVTHEIMRQKNIASLLIEIYMMTICGIIKKGAGFSASGAHVQAESSTNGNEAAHSIPRQLMIGKKPVQQLKKQFAELSVELNALFARVDDLPKMYNDADSRSEGNGLAKAFVDACQFVAQNAGNKVTPGLSKSISDGKFDEVGELTTEKLQIEIKTVILNALMLYQQQAKAAFTQVLDKAKARIAAKTAAPRHHNRLKIIPAYERVLRMSIIEKTVAKTDSVQVGTQLSLFEGLAVQSQQTQEAIEKTEEFAGVPQEISELFSFDRINSLRMRYKRMVG